ncbi:MAG: DMT family transporter [Ruminococcus sp.]|nr:DMT family transporter [Ruminococcus sp.]
MQNLLKNKYFAYLGALICAALWGTAFPIIKLGYNEFNISQSDIASKLLFAGERFAFAGVLVFIFGLIALRKPPIVRKSDFLPVAVLGVVQTTLQYLFAYVGVGFTTAVNTSIITGTVSIISVVLASFFFKNDRLNVVKIIGCLLGLIGIVYVNISDFSFYSVTFLGDIIVLFSAISGAGGNIITKKISGGKNPTSITACQLFLGGMILLIIGLVFGGRTDLTNVSGMVILFWLSLVSSVSFLLWTALLKYHPVSRITVFTMLVPIFGTVWSFILLGEEILKIENLISLVLICAGIVFVNIKTA